jgi:cyclohexadienyl dehydratase
MRLTFPLLRRGLCLFLLGLTLTATAQAGTRLDQIMERQTLRVGTPGDYRPFAMRNDAGGYEGHDIEVIEKMAADLGLRIEYVATSWSRLMADLHENKFDLAVGGITRNLTRMRQAAMLPGYAPFGKVALVRRAEQDKYQSLVDLNRPEVRVIKNPGGTNEAFVLAQLPQARISTHERNAEIPGLIASGQGDVMITETYEALHYARADSRLSPA